MDKEFIQIIKTRLDNCVFINDPFEVAQKHLLGSYLCSNIGGNLTVGMITELEVYFGDHDKACHAYPNKKTPRTEVLFRKGGCAYVTLIYGIYSQFNVVVGPEGTANAILIRSLEPIIGLDIMKKRRETDNLMNLTTGPGKLCQAMGIDYKKHHGIDLTGNEIWISPKISDYEYIESKRIGIDYAEEYVNKLWRFYIKDNNFISKK